MSDIDQRLVEKFKRATVTLDFLINNGSSHASPLSAIAELTDNAKDAGATKVTIDFVERDDLETIEVCDNGTGMTPEEVAHIVAFGHSAKRSETRTKIGRFGIGLKSGAFRLGSELLILTKTKDEIYTAMLLSTQFHISRGISEQVFVPCPSFDKEFNPITSDMKLHEAELKVIERFGPLGGESLKYLFSKIEGPSGTMIIIDKLRRDDHCRLEINFSKHDDFQLNKDNDDRWKSSLRSYLEILYQYSKMQIYLRGIAIEEKFVYGDWMFKQHVVQPNLQCKEHYTRALEEAEQKCTELANKSNALKDRIANDNNRVQLFRGDARTSQLQNRVLHEEASEAYKKAVAEKQALIKAGAKRPSTVFLVIGVNVNERSANGIYFYLNDRLIKVVRNISFFNTKDSIGISAKVNFNHNMFLPTNTKDDFANSRDLSNYLGLARSWLKVYLEGLKTSEIEKFLRRLPGTERMKFDTENIISIFWRVCGYPTETRMCVRTLPRKNTLDEIQKCAGWYSKCPSCGTWRCHLEDPGLGKIDCKRMKQTCGQGAPTDVLLPKLDLDREAPVKNNTPMRNSITQSVQPTLKLSEIQAAKRGTEIKAGTKRDHVDEIVIDDDDDVIPIDDDDVIAIDDNDDKICRNSKKSKTISQPNRGSKRGNSSGVSTSAVPTSSLCLGHQTLPSNKKRNSKSPSPTDTHDSSLLDEPSSSNSVSISRKEYEKLKAMETNVGKLMDWIASTPQLDLNMGTSTDPKTRLQSVIDHIAGMKKQKK